MLRIENLSKSYRAGDRRQVVFDALDLHLGPGEIVALLGASGSGKTTLLNILSGIDEPDHGSVNIAGTELGTLREPARTLFRRHHVGFVFQFFNLIPTLNVEENLLLPLELIAEPAGSATSRARTLLDAVGLPGIGSRFPDTLSGGEQQRVAVARALIHRPDLLLADEPTGNLDDATSQVVTRLLVDLARDQGTTMLIVTHSAQVAAVADRVLRLHLGQLQPA